MDSFLNFHMTIRQSSIGTKVFFSQILDWFYWNIFFEHRSSVTGRQFLFVLNCKRCIFCWAVNLSPNLGTAIPLKLSYCDCLWVHVSKLSGRRRNFSIYWIWRITKNRSRNYRQATFRTVNGNDGGTVRRRWQPCRVTVTITMTKTASAAAAAAAAVAVAMETTAIRSDALCQ